VAVGRRGRLHDLAKDHGLAADGLGWPAFRRGGLGGIWWRRSWRCSRCGAATKPADEDHAYGHAKAEYFSAGVEGALIFVAAISIAFTAIAAKDAPLDVR
jgi:hypothetical protein